MSPYTDKGILIEEYWKSWHIWCWLQVVWHTNHFHIFVFGWWRPPYPNGHQANFALICYPTERSSSWYCDQNPFIQSSKWHSILHLLLFRFLLTVRQHCGIPSIASRDFWYLPSGRVDSLKSAERSRMTSNLSKRFACAYWSWLDLLNWIYTSFFSSLAQIRFSRHLAHWTDLHHRLHFDTTIHTLIIISIDQTVKFG